MSIAALIDYSPEVAAARRDRRPIVALESTIITHGMPYPKNLETAQSLEATVRNGGAVPATIAVVDGRFKVGLDGATLEKLASLSGGVVKASRRDLSAIVARHGSAGTTVAATMYIADLAGIEIFATGGIGGVHRGAEETFDISADLIELSRTRVAVVCAGAKSILDIDKTLEYLESHGVAVCGYRCDEFPAFYARTSGVKLDHRCDGPHDLARILRLQREIGPGGLLIANPIPEDNALDAKAIEQRIAEAVAGSARARHRQKGGDAVSARPHRRADGRTQPRSQHGAGAQQRRRRRSSGGGIVQTLMSDAKRVLVIGDVMTDITAVLSGPIAVGSDRRARIHVRSRRLGGDAGCLAGPLRPERRFCRARRRCGFRARKRTVSRRRRDAASRRGSRTRDRPTDRARRPHGRTQFLDRPWGQ